MTAWTLAGEDGAALLVTQCDDVEEAKRVLLADPIAVRDAAELWEELADRTCPYLPPIHEPQDRAVAWLEQADARVEFGRFACTAYALYEGYRQVWIGWSAKEHERAHGETTAVRFTQPEARDD